MIDHFGGRIPEPSEKTMSLQYIGRYNTVDGSIKSTRFVDPKGRFTLVSTRSDYTRHGITLTKTECLKTFKNGRSKKYAHFTVSGSIHKYSNKGKHNYDQFTIKKYRFALRDIERHFGIDANNTILTSLEAGVNLHLRVPAARIIESIKCYKQKPYSKMFFADSRAEQLIYHLTQQKFKVYDKGLQFQERFGTNENLLRIELAMIKSQQFSTLEIKTLADLEAEDKWQKLGNKLITCSNQLVIFENKGDKKGMNLKSKELIALLNDRQNWLNVDKHTFKRHKKHLNKYSHINHLKDEILGLMQIEIEEMISK